MVKILVTPVSSSGVAPFEVEGDKLTKVNYHGDGVVYYIAGRSYPESIVTILQEE